MTDPSVESAEIQSPEDEIAGEVAAGEGVEEVEGVVVVVEGQEVHARGALPPGWSVRWMCNSVTGQEYKRYHGPDRAGAWVTQAQSVPDAWRKFEAARVVADPKPDPRSDS